MKPSAKMAAPSRQRSAERAAAFPQVKLVLSRETRDYLRATAKRLDLPERKIIDQMVIETKELRRRVEELGYENVGQLLAVFRALKERR